MRKKKKKRVFKKIILIILVVIIGYLFTTYSSKEDVLSIVNEKRGYISNYYVYGIHFNISGSIELKNLDVDDKINLVLKSSSDEIIVDAEIKKEDDNVEFDISDKINNGFNLNKLKKGKYYLLLKVTNKEKTDYYSFKSDNKEFLEYYTIDKNDNNKKILISYDKGSEVLVFDSKKIDSHVFYDVTIDPGHGGVDSGTSYTLDGKTYYESDLTLKVALSLKEELEKRGYKVLLTRKDDTKLQYYGDAGRAVLPNKYHTKLTISLHLNSDKSVMNYGGVEVYTPNDIDYNFASSLASNIVSYASTSYSKKKSDKVMDGVYYSYFDESDINESNLESVNNGIKTYDIKVGAPEMYMIREVGGKITKAYVDGRNKKIGLNPYYNSLISSEAYLIELGYISYSKDLKNIINNYDDYAKAISLAIDSYLK